MPNLTLLSIPAFWVLAVYPHTVAHGVLSKFQNSPQGAKGDDKKSRILYDNISPRATSIQERIHTLLPADQAAKYDRAKAAHANGLENLPLLAAAVLAGNLAGLHNSSTSIAALEAVGGGFQFTVGVIMVSRLAYNYFYLNTPEGTKTRATVTRYASMRSMSWAVGCLCSLGILIRAAWVMP